MFIVQCTMVHVAVSAMKPNINTYRYCDILCIMYNSIYHLNTAVYCVVYTIIHYVV